MPISATKDENIRRKSTIKNGVFTVKWKQSMQQLFLEDSIPSDKVISVDSHSSSNDVKESSPYPNQ